MSKNFDPKFVSGSAPVLYPSVAVCLEFPGGTVRVWSGYGTKVISSIHDSSLPNLTGSYLGVGTLGSISSITETNELAAKNVDIALSGIPNEIVGTALSENYRGRTATVLYNFSSPVDSQELTIITFRGRIDTMTVERGDDTSIVRLRCESRLIEMNRVRDSRYTPESQALIDPTDKGFDFVAGLVGKQIYWGNAAPAADAVSPDYKDGDGNFTFER